MCKYAYILFLLGRSTTHLTPHGGNWKVMPLPSQGVENSDACGLYKRRKNIREGQGKTDLGRLQVHTKINCQVFQKNDSLQVHNNNKP